MRHRQRRCRCCTSPSASVDQNAAEAQDERLDGGASPPGLSGRRDAGGKREAPGPYTSVVACSVDPDCAVDEPLSALSARCGQRLKTGISRRSTRSPATRPGAHSARLNPPQEHPTAMGRRRLRLHALGAADRARQPALQAARSTDRADLRSHQTQPRLRPLLSPRQSRSPHRMAPAGYYPQRRQAPATLHRAGK